MVLWVVGFSSKSDLGSKMCKCRSEMVAVTECLRLSEEEEHVENSENVVCFPSFGSV